MKMNKTETAIVDFYQSQKLDAKKVSALLIESDRIRKKSRFHKLVPLSAAASLLSLLLISGLYLGFSSNEKTISIVLQEASINHKSKLQMEFDTQDLPVLTRVMNKLDFPLLLPESMRQQFQILGARYCTLNGNLAAHVKLNASDADKPISLFMTKNRKDLLSLADQSDDIDGVSVSTWTADGMFYVLASH